MPIIKQEYIRRQDLRPNPLHLFVFGDNMIRCGFGGQAKECRGEPNAIGIPTKHFPRNDDAAFFHDDDFDGVSARIEQSFEILKAHLAKGGTVVIPKDGIGTGRAELQTRAPKIYKYIATMMGTLEDS
jgi:hypothetical protein